MIELQLPLTERCRRTSGYNISQFPVLSNIDIIKQSVNVQIDDRFINELSSRPGGKDLLAVYQNNVELILKRLIGIALNNQSVISLEHDLISLNQTFKAKSSLFAFICDKILEIDMKEHLYEHEY